MKLCEAALRGRNASRRGREDNKGTQRVQTEEGEHTERYISISRYLAITG